MTLDEIKVQLVRFDTPEKCDEYLRDRFHEIQPLFFGLTREELNERKFDYQDAFDEILTRSPIRKISNCNSPPNSIIAVLIFLISFFERTGLYPSILAIANILPPESLHNRALAMFEYKKIADTQKDYESKFPLVLARLQDTWDTGTARVRSQCEDMLIEYYSDAIIKNVHAKVQIHKTEPYVYFQSFFGTHIKIEKYSILNSTRFRVILELPLERLPDENDEANVRIAEAFFDEAMALIPEQIATVELNTCAAYCNQCVDGLHNVKLELMNRFPEAFAGTNTYLRQSLTSSVYLSFDETVQCIRYIRQSMMLHIPQIEKAVCRTLQQKQFPHKHIRILDVGCGPGTLYCVLAGMSSRNSELLNNLTIEYIPLEPSKPFFDINELVVKLVKTNSIVVGKRHNCRLQDLDDHDLVGIDWIFLGNALTPIIADSSRNIANASSLIMAALRKTKNSKVRLTLAENSRTADFEPFLQEIESSEAISQIGKVENISCNAPWIGKCLFNTTSTSGFIPTRPSLKLVTYEYNGVDHE